MSDLLKVFDVFRPVHDLWWNTFGQLLSFVLRSLFNAIDSVGVLQAVGAYGVAIVVMTILIKLALAPLYHFQLSTSRKTMAEQRKVAPQMAELRKKFKNDPQKLQQAQMELYREHGINPLGGAIGCLPMVVQLPILTALYYVFLGNARGNTFTDHFLWIPHLNDLPSKHPLFTGLPIPDLAYLAIPLLAALTTFVQSKMMQQPPNPAATEQEQQAAQMTQSMQVVMPLMIGYFAIATPAGLGLYWFVSNCFAIIQQYLVNGWGSLLPKRGTAPAATVVTTTRKGPDGPAGAPARTRPRRPRR